MTNKLATDGRAIGGDADQFHYIYSCLEPKVRDTVVAYVEKGGKRGRKNPKDFLDHLRIGYSDPNRAGRALDRLRSLKQGDKEPFHMFINKFERELFDAGGFAWPEEVCINYLDSAINGTLKDKLIIIRLPWKYYKYVSKL